MFSYSVILAGDFSSTDFLNGVNSASYAHGALITFLYVLVSVTLLMNVLIAMMGDTYRTVADKGKQYWLYARAQYLYRVDIFMLNSSRDNILDDESAYLMQSKDAKDKGSYYLHRLQNSLITEREKVRKVFFSSLNRKVNHKVQPKERRTADEKISEIRNWQSC